MTNSNIYIKLKGECEQQMFELYSCYENLHLEIVSNYFFYIKFSVLIWLNV